MDRGNDDEALRFAIAQTVQASLVDVRNLGAGDIFLLNDEAINNPVGETRILNAGGNIVAEPGAATYVVRTGTLGDAGTATVPADFEGEAAGVRRFTGVLQFIDAGGGLPDRLTRPDGASWQANGFVVGDLIKVEVAGQAPRVFQIAVFAGGNGQTAVLSTQAALGNQTVAATVSRFHGIAATGSVGTLANPVRVESINAPTQTRTFRPPVSTCSST